MNDYLDVYVTAFIDGTVATLNNIIEGIEVEKCESVSDVRLVLSQMLKETGEK